MTGTKYENKKKKYIGTPQRRKRGKKHIRIPCSLKTLQSAFTNALYMHLLHNLYVVCLVFVAVSLMTFFMKCNFICLFVIYVYTLPTIITYCCVCFVQSYNCKYCFEFTISLLLEACEYSQGLLLTVYKQGLYGHCFKDATTRI